MRTIDFSPLYRSTVGFDRLFSMLDSMAPPENGNVGYPPYNIERRDENVYRITMAIAGFAEDELLIESKANTLAIRGEKQVEEHIEGREMLYQGIAARSFERRFQLADHMEVTSASMENGLLHIDLKREIPDTLKPRTIRIDSVDGKPALNAGDAGK